MFGWLRSHNERVIFSRKSGVLASTPPSHTLPAQCRLVEGGMEIAKVKRENGVTHRLAYNFHVDFKSTDSTVHIDSRNAWHSVTQCALPRLTPLSFPHHLYNNTLCSTAPSLQLRCWWVGQRSTGFLKRTSLLTVSLWAQNLPLILHLSLFLSVGLISWL